MSSYSLNSTIKIQSTLATIGIEGETVESNGIRTPFHFPILNGGKETLKFIVKHPKVKVFDLLVTLVQEHRMV